MNEALAQHAVHCAEVKVAYAADRSLVSDASGLSSRIALVSVEGDLLSCTFDDRRRVTNFLGKGQRWGPLIKQFLKKRK
jgi:hypothetical protein